jgi:hypothetical protein
MCDRGYGGTGISQCVSKGIIRNLASDSYLCDGLWVLVVGGVLALGWFVSWAVGVF